MPQVQITVRLGRKTCMNAVTVGPGFIILINNGFNKISRIFLIHNVGKLPLIKYCLNCNINARYLPVIQQFITLTRHFYDII